MAPALPPPSSVSSASSTGKRARDASSVGSHSSSTGSIKKPRWGAPPLSNSSSKLARPTAFARGSTTKTSTSVNSSTTSTRGARGNGISADDLARLQYDSLRMSNEQLRSENEQLQVEVEILEESARKLEQRLASSNQRVTALENERARWHESLEPSTAFAHTAYRSTQLPVSCIPAQDDVHAVVLDLVAAVEARAREERVAERECEIDAARLTLQQQQRELERAMQRMQHERAESDAFEALERRVLDDRVAELEVQLAQNRLRECEKDAEITRLRTEQDELSATSCVIAKRDWDAHADAHKQLGHEADAWRAQCEVLQDELRMANTRVLELEDALRVAQSQDETRAFEALEKRILEERIEELESQTQMQTQDQIQTHQLPSSDARLAELEQQRLALADELEAAQMQLSVADAESKVKRNEVARLLHDRAALKKQLKALAGDLTRVLAQADESRAQAQTERARATQLADEAARLQRVHDALLSQQRQQQAEQQQKVVEQKESAERMDELARLEAREQELTGQLALAQQQLADSASSERNAFEFVESTGGACSDDVARLEREKRELQEFVRCYYEAAETRCRQLLHALAQHETQHRASPPPPPQQSDLSTATVSLGNR